MASCAHPPRRRGLLCCVATNLWSAIIERELNNQPFTQESFDFFYVDCLVQTYTPLAKLLVRMFQGIEDSPLVADNPHWACFVFEEFWLKACSVESGFARTRRQF